MTAAESEIFGRKTFIFCGFSEEDVGALSEFVTEAGGKMCRSFVCVCGWVYVGEGGVCM